MKILFFGDSITDAGRNRDKDVRFSNSAYGVGYVMQVAGRLFEKSPVDYEVVNRGISGHRIVDLYARAKIDCWNHNPDLISILIGINDIWHEVEVQNGVEPERFERIYRMLIEDTMARLPNTKLLLCSPFVLKGSATEEHWEEFSECAVYERIVEKLAKDIAAGKVSNDDLAEEINFVDMASGEITQTARFIIDADSNLTDPDYERTPAYFRKMIEAEFPDVGISENVDVHTFAPDADTLCTPLSLLVSKDGKAILGICVVSKADSTAKGVKLTKAACVKAKLEYLRFISNEENRASNVLPKIRAVMEKEIYSTDRLESISADDPAFEAIDYEHLPLRFHVKVKFPKGCYAYACYTEIAPGDVVLVKGAREGCPGLVVGIEPVTVEKSGAYPVTHILRETR